MELPKEVEHFRVRCFPGCTLPTKLIWLVVWTVLGATVKLVLSNVKVWLALVGSVQVTFVVKVAESKQKLRLVTKSVPLVLPAKFVWKINWLEMHAVPKLVVTPLASTSSMKEPTTRPLES